MIGAAIGVVVLLYLYMNANSKVNGMRQLLQERDRRIRDLEREVEDLRRNR